MAAYKMPSHLTTTNVAPSSSSLSLDRSLSSSTGSGSSNSSLGLLSTSSSSSSGRFSTSSSSPGSGSFMLTSHQSLRLFQDMVRPVWLSSNTTSTRRRRRNSKDSLDGSDGGEDNASGTDDEHPDWAATKRKRAWKKGAKAKALKQIEAEIHVQKKNQSDLEKLIAHSKRLGEARRRSGHDVGAMLSMRQQLRHEAEEKRAGVAVTKLQELLQRVQKSDSVIRYQTEVDSILAQPPPTYLMYDAINDILLEDYTETEAGAETETED